MEKFVLEGEFLKVSEEAEEIPADLGTAEFFIRHFVKETNDFAREIDFLFYDIGLDVYISPLIRYMIVASLIIVPLVMLLVIMICLVP